MIHLLKRSLMLLDIDHHSGMPIYRQIIDQVREQIMAGMLKEGDQLMPVRELSEQLAVNPMTVSKAYSAMETEGLLERRRGIGLFISGVHSSRKEQNKEATVETLLSKVVATAVQYGLSEEKTQKMLKELFKKYHSVKRRASDV
jgi:GntR family transcriptional regulator